MLSARAYSFKQKSRLAISISWVGGYVNVVLFMATGAFISHASGNATQFGHTLGNGDWSAAAFFGFLILSFTLGVAKAMDINNLCTDLEFAIARAMAILDEMGLPRG